MKKILFVLSLLFTFSLSAQVEYKVVQSEILQAEREVKIQLPRGYESDSTKIYPVILVLDGDYLYEPVAGLVDYYSYWDDMPDALVVGVNQGKTRQKDVYYSPQTSLPVDTGADFFEFIGQELLPLLDENYRTADFRTIIGHDRTANFLNYYLLKEQPIFQAYVNLSPDYAPKNRERVVNKLAKINQETWYYLATSKDDVTELHKEILKAKKKLKEIKNEKLHFNFDNFENATHYSLAAQGIPRALETIFSVYSPISDREYREKLKKTEGTFVDYLKEKYDKIQNLYGLNNRISVNDFMQVSSAIEEEEKWDQYRDLARLSEDEQNQTMLPNFFWGRYYEETGSPKRAVEAYEGAYSKKEASYLNRDYMLNLAQEIKDEIGE